MTALNLLITGATGSSRAKLCAGRIAAGYNVLAMVRRNSVRTRSWRAGTIRRRGPGRSRNIAGCTGRCGYRRPYGRTTGRLGPAGKISCDQCRGARTLALRRSADRSATRWIQISSQGVYPVHHHYGTDESVPPELNNLDGYTQTKAEAEVIVQQHVREYGLPAVILGLASFTAPASAMH